MRRYWNNDFNNMMNFRDLGSGWFIVFEIIKLIIIVVLVIVIARMFIKSYNSKNISVSNRAVQILKERYASGEISEEEYRKKLAKLNE